MRGTGFVIAAVGSLVLAACSSTSKQGNSSNGAGAPTAPSQQESAATNVKVDRVRVFVKDGRVQAFVQGQIGDGCTKLQPMSQSRSGNELAVNVTSIRQGEVCTMIMQLLNGYVPLNGTFEPGTYTVRANTATATFTVTRDSSGQLAIDPDPGPLPDGPTYQ
jgi:hypothetical protein